MPININIEGPEAKNRRLMQEQEQALRIQILKQQIAQSQPGYSSEIAGRLGRGLEESERNLQLQDELLSDLSKRKQNVAAAATPLQPQVVGPVMPEQTATAETNKILTAEDQMKLDRAAFSASREALRKELEGFTGTVPLPTGGTYAAGETSTIRRRFDDTAKLIQDYQQRVANAQSPEEANALQAAYSMFEPIQKQQLKKDLESSRTIPGLEGFGKDEQSTNEMRKSIVDFSAASQNIDDLLNLANHPGIQNYAKSQAIRAGLRGQLRLLIAGPGAMSDQDVALMNEVIANPYTTLNAKDRLLALKGAMARKIVASASAYGFKVKRLSDLVGAGGQPEDFNEFTSFIPAYRNEADARNSGYKDGDIVKIGGKKYRLGP